MTKTAIVILPAFACLALYGRGESKPWPPDSIGNDQQRVLTLQQQMD
jgi:hypothetical protein